jgi:hypothetical protein
MSMLISHFCAYDFCDASHLHGRYALDVGAYADGGGALWYNHVLFQLSPRHRREVDFFVFWYLRWI